MKWRLFNLAAAVSLALLLLILSLAILRNWAPPSASTSGGRFMVTRHAGSLVLHVPSRSHSVGLYAEDIGVMLVVRDHVAARETAVRFLGAEADTVPGKGRGG